MGSGNMTTAKKRTVGSAIRFKIDDLRFKIWFRRAYAIKKDSTIR